MQAGQLRAVVRQVEQAAGEGVSDGSLLREFTDRGDESAFAALVRRHGPLVLGVCRRLLNDVHLAEDAFQATFLVLLRRAGSLTGGDSLAGWLHTVAYHIALRARAAEARRRAAETRAADMGRLVQQPEDLPANLRPVLDEELHRLPEKYRLPLVLCHLDCRTNDEAARLLGCPVGTVKSRLARGRMLLRRRLEARGIVPAAGALAFAKLGAASAAVPAALVAATVRSAGLVASGKRLPGNVGRLTDAAMKGMLVARLRGAGAVALVLILVVSLGAAAALVEPHRPAAEAVANPPAKDQVNPAPAGQGVKPFELRGRVLAPSGEAVASARIVALTTPWRYTHQGEPRVEAGHEVLAEGTADAEGKFALRVPRDRWAFAGQSRLPVQILATARGFGPAWEPVLLADPGVVRGEVTLRLAAEEAVVGRVIDLQGRAAAGVQLAVVRVGRADGGQAREWEFHGVGDVLQERFGRAGMRLGKEDTLTAFRAAAGMNFWKVPADVPSWPGPVTTDADGRFRLHGVTRAQPVALLALDARHARQFFEIRVAKDLLGGPVTLTVLPPRRIEGTVTAADTGKPLAGALVQVDVRADYTGSVPHELVDDKGRRYVTRRYGHFGFTMPYMPAVRTDAQGRFRVEAHVAEDFEASRASYTVTVSAPDGLAYQSAEEQFRWPRGAEQKKVTMRLEPGVLTRVRVIEGDKGRPIAGARVDFWSRGLKVAGNTLFPGPRTCDAAGECRLVLPPGKWHVVVNAPKGPDGVTAVRNATWDVVVNAPKVQGHPDPPYAAEPVEAAELTAQSEILELGDRQPREKGPRVCRPAAVRVLELRPGAAPVDVRVTLRRLPAPRD